MTVDRAYDQLLASVEMAIAVMAVVNAELDDSSIERVVVRLKTRRSYTVCDDCL